MAPSIQQENSKLEKAGKVNALPSPALAQKPHSAQVSFLEHQRPLSFVSRIDLSQECRITGDKRNQRVQDSVVPVWIPKVTKTETEQVQTNESSFKCPFLCMDTVTVLVPDSSSFLRAVLIGTISPAWFSEGPPAHQQYLD